MVVVAEVQREDRDAAVTEVEQMLRGGARAAAVVDRDERHAGHVRRVGDHQRQPPLERGRHARMAVGERVDEAGVDERAGHGVGLAPAPLRRGGQERERDADLLGLDGEAAKGGDGGGVAERVGEALGEEDADRTRATRAQGPTGRVGPRVAELGREREHALTQCRVQLVGPVERVRRRGAGDAEPVGEGLQRHPVSHGRRGYLARRPRRTGAVGSAERARLLGPVMSRMARAVRCTVDPFWID